MADGPTDGQALRWKYDGVSCNMKRSLAQLWGAWIWNWRKGNRREKENREKQEEEQQEEQNKGE